MEMRDGERLVVVETELRSVKSDVSEIKADVKALTTAVHDITVSLAERDAAEAQLKKDRGSNGVWARSIVPWIISGTAVTLTVLHMVLEELAKKGS